MVVEALGPAFGGAAAVEAQLRAVHCKAWAADPFTFEGAAVSAAPGASGLGYTNKKQQQQQQQQPQPLMHRDYGHGDLRAPHGRLHFAGTESEALHGHVEGALAAAERAAREVLAAGGALRRMTAQPGSNSDGRGHGKAAGI